MNQLAALPPWAALLVGALAFAGALLALIGCIGLLQLQRFYQRVHAPTLAATVGLYLMVAAAVVFFSLAKGRPVLHIVLIAACVLVTTPITLMLLVRAALARDHKQGNPGVPPLIQASIDAEDDSA
ncbi:MAG TPA: monovalent cation/H(+) antiporter subunit G [Salinisphaeraceae bacterium]|nr:monovalent cation/H(+) antiporter subunit G [Salinisphaeraceae bacterium]